jgi:hypothetical protein
MFLWSTQHASLATAGMARTVRSHTKSGVLPRRRLLREEELALAQRALSENGEKHNQRSVRLLTLIRDCVWHAYTCAGFPVPWVGNLLRSRLVGSPCSWGRGRVRCP